MKPVRVRSETLVLPTYLPAVPDRNPMFLEKRVYQGSSGKVYPLPFTDRIAETPVERKWQAIWIENEYLKVLVLPELGGRIHRIIDKTNGYDTIYRQDVIKPALVGLAGPWVSGGIEFNWPQHHRPATFLPTEVEIEKGDDGSVTVWCSDHDPMCRMKGMHGVCLRPGRSAMELRVRAYNRTPFVQTFLWWANVATEVHEAYQSFFPPDVCFVADHAKRAMSEYPLAQGHYYGVDYGERGRSGGPGANDLSFYANIPVPTSYMCMGSKEDFFGGYDHRERAGIVHVANHHISPGKKQWTWGNHEFGHAWDRNLTDARPNREFPPYIEIMAGVYTDNQPDFSFLQPGETKTWSQYWYPIREIGPAHHANLDAAVRLTLGEMEVSLGVAVTRSYPKAVITIEHSNGKRSYSRTIDLSPGKPFTETFKQGRKPLNMGEVILRVTDRKGMEIISHQPKVRVMEEIPAAATEPPAPGDISSADELFITGLHLDQYRHATRSPVDYWREAIRRDPEDSRCNNALGLWHLKRGEFSVAELHFRIAIGRLTRRNANPYDGEAYYHLGLTLRFLNRDDEAYDAFNKGCWNQAWMAAGYHAIAEIDCCRGHWRAALGHLNLSLRHDIDHLRARSLKVLVLRKLKRKRESNALLKETAALDPLDGWTRVLAGRKFKGDAQAAIDLAHDLARAGWMEEAIDLLENVEIRSRDLPDQSLGALPLVGYTLGWLHAKCGNQKAALKCYRRASKASADYCFPARLEEIEILESAITANPADARAPYYLGNLLYDRRRHEEAMRHWESSAALDPGFSIVWRNLGIGSFNIGHDARKARNCYDKAFAANPSDARLLYERDQLWKRLGESPSKRLNEMDKHPELVSSRDDLSIELCALCNQTGRHRDALDLVSSRNFQPWEGGEGGPLGQWVRSHLMLGREALNAGEPAKAGKHFTAALNAPPNLGEAKHLLANQSDIHYWLGRALAAAGESEEAERHWAIAATFKGDFQEMSVRAFSEMTYYSALSWRELGQSAKADQLLHDLAGHAEKLQASEAKIDYFATSLPTMLLFDDDLQFRQETSALFLRAQALLGLEELEEGRALLAQVLERDPSHALAADLMGAPGHG